MPARALGPAVLIDGDTLPTLRWAVAVAVREKRRNGTRPGPILAALDQAAAQAMTATRQDDLPAPAPDPHSTQWLTAGQVADRLGISRRHAQRLAATLDARRVGQTLLFDPDTVHEYATRKKEHHAVPRINSH